MISLKIDNKTVKVEEGSPVILAAKHAGIEIPSMCWREGKPHLTSCMICLVKDGPGGKLFPSCSVEAKEGMEIITLDDEIREARKTGLELLLSEHVGDCEAPCQLTCPAHMDIPRMNRLLARGEFEEALKIIKKDIALPAVFGRVCPAPCEGACRRKQVDEPVSICLLKRAAGDHKLGQEGYLIPEKEKDTGKKVGVIGAGPAGLAAAYFLQLKGYSCTVYDRDKKPGGSLWKEVEAGALPTEVLEMEVDIIRGLGAEFKMEYLVDRDKFREISKGSDAILIAAGMNGTGVENWGLDMTDRGVDADMSTYRVGETGIFVAGSALRPAKLAIRTLGQGKEVSFSIDQYLQGKQVEGEKFMFNSRFSRLMDIEIAEYLKESVEGKRIEPAEPSEGLDREQVMREAARCLHCDCRDIDTCRLRIYSDAYHADQKRFKSEERKPIKKYLQRNVVVYEPAKCIRCGICVEITAEHAEKYGLTFIGRGFDIEVGIPFEKDIEQGLEKVALEAADACPTGALARAGNELRGG